MAHVQEVENPRGQAQITHDQSQDVITFIVEHLDPELGPWSTLEYQAIAEECSAQGAKFCLSSVPKALKLPEALQNLHGLVIENRSVEDVFISKRGRICLLDPAAPMELSPNDASLYDTFLFGGILGRRFYFSMFDPQDG